MPKQGVDTARESHQIQLQQGLEHLSFDISDDQRNPLDSEIQLGGDQGEQLIQVLRSLFSLPYQPIHERDSLEELLEANGLHYRPAVLNANKADYQQVPAIASRKEDRSLIVIDPTKDLRLYELNTGEWIETSYSSIAQQLEPTIYEIYPVFPSELKSMRGLLGFVFPAIWPELWKATGIAAGLILFALVSPLLTAQVLGEVVPSGDKGWIVSTFVISVLIAAYQASFKFIQSFYLIRLGERLNLRVQVPLFNRILSYPIEFLDQHSVGDLSSRASALNAVIAGMSSSTLQAVIGSLSLIGYAGLMIHYDASLSLYALAVIAVSGVIEIAYARRSLRFERRYLEADAETYEETLQLLGAISQIRTRAAEPYILRRWYERLRTISSLQFSIHKWGDYSAITSRSVMAVGSTVIYLALILRMLGSGSNAEFSIAISTFIIFTQAYSKFSSQAIQIVNLFNQVLGSIWMQWKRALPLLQQPAEHGMLGRRLKHQVQGAIEFRNVDFTYPGAERSVLNDVSFTLLPGKFNVIFGESGCGKSTILSLIIRFYELNAGKILFDGKELVDLDIRYLRKQVGAILQSPSLPPGSIKEAVTSGLAVDESLIWNALEKVNLVEEVQNLPMQLETVLSEGASNISGGQRQRLCIARALLNKPKLILEDEATSALDNASQAIVSASLRSEGITRVVVAHRLSAIRDCDHMVVIHNKTVECEGSFDYCSQHSPYLQSVLRSMEVEQH